MTDAVNALIEMIESGWEFVDALWATAVKFNVDYIELSYSYRQEKT